MGDQRGIFARYLTAAVLARLADDGSRVAFVLLALARTDSAAFGGAIVAALLVPHVIAAPVVGAIADRVRRRKLFHAAALIAFGAALAACALLIGRAPAPAVLLAAAAGGCCGPLVTGGLTSLLGDLVPEEGRDRAYGLDVATYSVAGIAGPALAAVLATILGPTVAALVLVAGAGLAAPLLATLPLGPREAAGAHPPLTEGIATLWRDGTLRAATIASSIGHAGSGAFPLVAAILGARYASPALAGAFVSASAVGGLLGSLGYARWPFGTARPARTVLWCLLGTALPLALVPVLPGLLPGLVLFGLAGVCGSPLGSSLFLVREQRTPPGVRTQVFALGGGLKYAAAALGAALAGAGAALGTTPLLLASAGCYALGAAAGALLLRGEEAQRAEEHCEAVRA